MGTKKHRRGPQRSIKRHITELINMPGSKRTLGKYLLLRVAR